MILLAAIVVAVLAGGSWWSLLLVVLAAFVEVGEFLLGLRFTRLRRERKLLGRRGWMRDDGVADIGGELWEADGAAAGDRVEVVAVEGRRLLVRRVAP